MMMAGTQTKRASPTITRMTINSLLMLTAKISSLRVNFVMNALTECQRRVNFVKDALTNDFFELVSLSVELDGGAYLVHGFYGDEEEAVGFGCAGFGP